MSRTSPTLPTFIALKPRPLSQPSIICSSFRPLPYNWLQAEAEIDIVALSAYLVRERTLPQGGCYPFQATIVAAQDRTSAGPPRNCSGDHVGVDAQCAVTLLSVQRGKGELRPFGSFYLISARVNMQHVRRSCQLFKPL